MSHDNTDSFSAVLQNFKAKLRCVNFPTSPFNKLDLISSVGPLFVLNLNRVAVDSRWTLFFFFPFLNGKIRGGLIPTSSPFISFFFN